MAFSSLKKLSEITYRKGKGLSSVILSEYIPFLEFYSPPGRIYPSLRLEGYICASRFSLAI